VRTSRSLDRLDPIERLAELEKDRTQAKGDIREILDLSWRRNTGRQFAM
jgi:hypothetical protein